MEKISNPLIVITSNEPWGEVWFSKQHYANELAKSHVVYFLNPPKKWGLKNFFSLRVTIREERKGLFVLDYHNNFPVRIFKTFFRFLNDLINCWKLKKSFLQNKEVIFWLFDPFRFSNTFFIKSVAKVYHVTDPFIHLPNDKKLARRSDLVVTIMERDLDHYKFYNDNVLLIPHGFSHEELNVDKQIENDIRNKYGDFILLIATLNDFYNISLLVSCVEKYPENGLVIIGPSFLKNQDKIIKFNELISFPNCHYLGLKEASVLKNYVKASKVCIVPYDFGIENIKGTPLKVLNYLVHHKPTITSIKTGLEEFIGIGVEYCTNSYDFICLVGKALDDNFSINGKDLSTKLEKREYPFLIENILNKLKNLD